MNDKYSDTGIYEDMQNRFDKKLDKEKQSAFFLHVKKGVKQRRTKYISNLFKLGVWVEITKNKKKNKNRKKRTYKINNQGE